MRWTISSFLGLTLSVLMFTGLSQDIDLDIDDDEGEDEGGLTEFAAELGIDMAEGTPVRLVMARDAKKSIDEHLFWRQIPGYIAASTFPLTVEIGGKIAIRPKKIVLPDKLGMATVYETHGRVVIPAGTSHIMPGKIPITWENDQPLVNHPAIKLDEQGIRILCAPVRFDAVDEQGTATPVRVRVGDGRINSMRTDGPYNPLIMWLPVGIVYKSTFGSFKLLADGKVKPLKLAKGVKLTTEGFRLSVKSKRRKTQAALPLFVQEGTFPAQIPASRAPPANKLHLWPHRGRRVFAQGETWTFYALASRGFKGGDAGLFLGRKRLGKLRLPAVVDRAWDSRAITVRMADIAPGDHQLLLQGRGWTSQPLPITVVRWQRRSPFLVHTMSCCTEAPPTDSKGLALLRDSGMEMLTWTGHVSSLDTVMPRAAPPRDRRLPAELGLVRPANDVLLERMLRYRMRHIDLTVGRGASFYLEGLSYHHSYKPSVDRMIRRMSVFTQQAADYPSFWGVNYSWFPKPGGYAEGGVPCDAHVHDRNVALGQRLAKAGHQWVPHKERKWYHENKFSKDPKKRAKAMTMLKQIIERWRAYNKFGFGEHNALYNAAVRMVRPGTECVLFDNAGHDAWNRARSQFNDMAAACYESYTDYGEWPMSTGFTTDWARGTSPGQPVWITVDWGTSPAGMMRSLFHGFARGLQGGGCPMQAGNDPRELARRGKGLRLAQRYGSIIRFAQPERRVAILATLSQRMFDGRAYYACHAIYYHLTRIGYPPVIIDEEDVMARGAVPPDTKVLFLVRQEQPLQPELLAILRKYIKGGGKVFATGDSTVELNGVTKVGGEVKDIWRLSGFHPGSHQDMWKQFKENWQEPLTAAMRRTGLPTLAETDPYRGLALTMDVGPVRYVVVIADTYNTHANDFRVTEKLGVSLHGTGWQIRDLVRQTNVKINEKNGRTQVMLDLITEPLTILALLRSSPKTIRIETAGTVFRAAVTAADGKSLGRVPLAYTFVDPAGKQRDQLYRAAGEELGFAPPAHDIPGKWTVRVQELLSGLTAILAWNPPRPKEPQTVAAIGDVQVVDSRSLREFAAAPGEKVVLLEPNQRQLLPLARKLVAKLRQKKVAARLWEVRPEEFDTVPLRWYPRTEDVARLKLIEAGKLIGYRQNLVPYIDKRKRAHVPKKGGYAAINPPWMLGRHAIIFSGGKLAESLREVTSWMPTANTPGKGQGRLLVCFSPFTANHHVAVVAANDPEGMAKAAERLAQFFPATKAPPEKKPRLIWQTAAVRLESRPVATPFLLFRQYRRVMRLLALEDGRSVLYLKGDKDRFAFVSAQGKVSKTCAAGSPREVTLDNAGNLWVYWRQGARVMARCISPNGEVRRDVEAHPALGGFSLPPNRSPEASFQVSPDGKTAAFARFGGIMFGELQKGTWRLYNDLPHVVRRYEVWNPRFPIGMTFSPDGRYVFFTMDTRPTGYTNMSGISFTPTGNETVLFDTYTGKRVWSKRLSGKDTPKWTGHFYGNHLDSMGFVTHSGFAALARDAKMTALADFVGRAMLLDKTGRVVLNRKVYDYDGRRDRRHYAWGPMGGVGVWISPGGELALFGYKDKVILARGRRAVEVAVPEMVSGAVANDGSFAVAGMKSGVVIALNPDGKERWRFDSKGIVPQVAAAGPNQVLVANHKGELMRVAGTGEQVWYVHAAKVLDRERHPVIIPRQRILVPKPKEYREPQTLAIARKLLQAKKIASWTPAGLSGFPTRHYGRKFYLNSKPIRLRTGNAKHAFIHLVYRRPKNNRSLTVLATIRRQQESFILDLPTPEYRVVDIPAPGAGAVFEVRTQGPVEIAECSVWGFSWPGPNVALVNAAEPGEEGLADEDEDDDDLGLGGELDDLDREGKGLSGKLKTTKIYWWNSDPDKVKGEYLRPGLNPQRVVDGERFSKGRPPLWSGQDMVGPWFTVDFPYPVKLSLVATYDKETRQSRVSQAIAAFVNHDATQNRGSGQVMGGAIFNDQFWRVFPAKSPIKTKRLGVHVRGGSQSLSEVEAYIKP